MWYKHIKRAGAVPAAFLAIYLIAGCTGPAEAKPPPVAAGEVDAVTTFQTAVAQREDAVASVETEPAATDIFIPVSEGPACEFVVRCDTILLNMDRLDPEKAELVPPDGMILHLPNAAINENESVFDVVLREMKGAKIHFEFTGSVPLNTVYINGINNLYEFDCGELSGWTYMVNGVAPGIGCSAYFPSAGDVVEIVYTCDLGEDAASGSVYDGAAGPAGFLVAPLD